MSALCDSGAEDAEIQKAMMILAGYAAQDPWWEMCVCVGVGVCVCGTTAENTCVGTFKQVSCGYHQEATARERQGQCDPGERSLTSRHVCTLLHP